MLNKSHEKYKARHDQHGTDNSFKVGGKVWLQLKKERLQGPGKKIKALQYGPFKIFEKVGDNAYRLSLHPYMHIFSIVNVENIKLYKPSMLDQEEEKVLPSIDELTPYDHERVSRGHIFSKAVQNYKTGAT
jgi:hypothetical protein